MENKYYSPNSSEFYLGCEFEQLYEGRWDSRIFWFGDLKWESDSYSETIRMKYLDKEDIESLGWKQTHKVDPFLNIHNNFEFRIEDGFNTGIRYELNLYPNQRIYLKWESYSSWGSFSGENYFLVNNKNELKVLMKMLKINDNNNN